MIVMTNKPINTAARIYGGIADEWVLTMMVAKNVGTRAAKPMVGIPMYDQYLPFLCGMSNNSSIPTDVASHPPPLTRISAIISTRYSSPISFHGFPMATS